MAIYIQRVFRGFIVRECERMRGPAAKDCTLCNNTTDFQTMELLSILPRERLFSYRDKTGFVYGFDIFSLIEMYKCKGKLVNPYNREDMPPYAIRALFSIYKKTILLHPTYISEQNADDPIYIVPNSYAETNTNTNINHAIEYLTPTEEPAVSVNQPTTITSFPPINYQTTEQSIAMVFERIKHLVNGEVNSEWFSQLTIAEYDRFYHFYYIWWSRSSTLSEETKSAICATPNPFLNLHRIDETCTTEFYKSICLDVIIAMVCTGVDEYHCSLGAKHVLTMLTVVSRPARRIWQNLFNELC
jgi:hypothetical protein